MTASGMRRRYRYGPAMRARGAPAPVVLGLVLLAAACAIAPFLRWVSTTGYECGWTCYVPLGDPPIPVELIGAAGWTVAAPLQVALVLLALVAGAVALTVARRHPAAGRAAIALTILAGAVFLWVLRDVLAWSPTVAAGRAAPDAFALTGPGAVVALVATGAGALLGCALVLAGRRLGRGEPED
jgi:hypothetical protein